jgi:hypothetical protein
VYRAGEAAAADRMASKEESLATLPGGGLQCIALHGICCYEELVKRMCRAVSKVVFVSAAGQAAGRSTSKQGGEPRHTDRCVCVWGGGGLSPG